MDVTMELKKLELFVLFQLVDLKSRLGLDTQLAPAMDW